MKKQTKNWWLFEYTFYSKSCDKDEFRISHKIETFYGNFNETFAFIFRERGNIFFFTIENKDNRLQSEKTDSFYCKDGELSYSRKPENPSKPCCYYRQNITMLATCLKQNGKTDLKKSRVIIQKFDELMQNRRGKKN